MMEILTSTPAEDARPTTAPRALGGRRPPRLRASHLVRRGVLWLVLALGAAAFSAVLVYALTSALKPADEVFQVPLQWWPSSLQWHNFIEPFANTSFARFYLNSTVVGVAVTFLNVVTCTLAGYSFSKYSYPGRDAVFVIVLATLMVPLEVIYVPLYALMYNLGWVNSFAGLIIPAATNAFGIFLMRQGIDAVPDDLLEAARLDGAGEIRTLLTIVVPMVRGPMAALALFIFMMNWDSHLWPLLIAQDDAHRTLPVGLAAMQANNLGAAGVPTLMAAALLALLPTLLLFLSLQRRFVEGVAMSAGLK